MLDKIKKISIRDMLGIFKFLLVLVPSIIYGVYLRIARKQLWLICEREVMARDNGLAFFEYMQKKHPELKSYYAINRKNNDYKHVEKFAKDVVQWASLKHYFLYMSATRNISSHKEGNPNQTLFTILHLYLNLYNNRVFLQHGITKDDAKMFYYKNTKFKFFICGAKPEFEYIKKHFGYPEGHVIYTGFARFDKLNLTPNQNVIAFIPTWRRNLDDENFSGSRYRKNILSLVNSQQLEEYLESTDKTLYFYPHTNAQRFFNTNDIVNRRVKLCNKNNTSINWLINNAAILITDYSSVFFDFAYLGKLVIYYQPDYEEYRREHGLDTGYFDYRKHGFGPVDKTVREIVESLKRSPSLRYINKQKQFFLFNAKLNCERIYKEIS